MLRKKRKLRWSESPLSRYNGCDKEAPDYQHPSTPYYYTHKVTERLLVFGTRRGASAVPIFQRQALRGWGKVVWGQESLKKWSDLMPINVTVTNLGMGSLQEYMLKYTFLPTSAASRLNSKVSLHSLRLSRIMLASYWSNKKTQNRMVFTWLLHSRLSESIKNDLFFNYCIGI